MIILDYKEMLFELINKFESANIGELTLKSGDFEITMKKNGGTVQPAAEATAVIRNENIMIKPVMETASPLALAENERIIKAEIIGTYYSAPSAGADDFVFVGKKVAKGDILCIISAMKVMNDVEAEYDCEILEIYNSNESVVEYGADLFKIRIS